MARLCNCAWVDRWPDEGLFCAWCGGARDLVPPPMLPAPPKPLALPARAGMARTDPLSPQAIEDGLTRSRMLSSPVEFTRHVGIALARRPGARTPDFLIIDEPATTARPAEQWKHERHKLLREHIQLGRLRLAPLPASIGWMLLPYREAEDLLATLRRAGPHSFAVGRNDLPPVDGCWDRCHRRRRRVDAQNRHVATVQRRRERRAARRERRHPAELPELDAFTKRLRSMLPRFESFAEKIEQFRATMRDFTEKFVASVAAATARSRAMHELSAHVVLLDASQPINCGLCGMRHVAGAGCT